MITKSPRSILPFVCAAGTVAAMLFGGAVSTAFAAASLMPLGDLPGDPSSIANGVSGDGSVVVGIAGGYGGQAYRWTAAGGMVGLGRPPGDFYSYARAVNGDGSVVVGGSQYADVQSEIDRTQAARWTAAGGMQGLGHLPGGGAISVALGVSGDGSVIVGASDSASGHEAFRWTASGGMQGLGDLPGGGFQSEANGVSADGSVIVGFGYSASDYEAFRWTSAGGMVGLGFLPGDLNSQAYGVSADGSIVVGTSSSMSGVHLFRWTSADGMVGLGNLPGGFNPMGFSADGSVVVGYQVQYDVSLSPHYTALYCSDDGGVRALWDVLLSHGVDPAADGWSRLEFAKALSADGNTIVGDGIRNGNQEAFVAVIPTIVPEPAAGALALLGASSILLLRRRSLGRPNMFLWAAGGFRARKQIMRSRRFTLMAIPLCTSAAARAFAAASLTPLGVLPGGTGSVANGVSADGSVVVGYSNFNYGLDGIEAFRWTRNGGMVGLGDLPGGSTNSEATGVSGDGSVIVGTSESASGLEAFRWTSGGGMVGLGDLPGGQFSSYGLGVSGDGSVIVGTSYSASGGEAFRWTSDGGMVGLGGLPGGSWSSDSGANAVSGDGSVVVGWNYLVDWDFPDGYYRHDYEAFRWTSDGGMVGLGHLFSGETGEPTGVSADGSVIVGYSLSSGFEAFRWTSDGGMERLWDVLLAAGVDPVADGWTELGIAQDISADGNTIVGYGTRNGNAEAFVAVIPIVPEPAGDFNHDGIVDAADYVVWRKSPSNFGGNPNGYNIWRAQFGQTSGGGVEARMNAVPEPSSLALLALAGLAQLRRRHPPRSACMRNSLVEA